MLEVSEVRGRSWEFLGEEEGELGDAYNQDCLHDETVKK